MANGFFLGGFGKGLGAGREQALAREQLGLMQQREQFDQSRALSDDATKAIGSTMQFVGQTIADLKAAGVPPEKINAAIEPLLKDVEEIASGVGLDPTRFRNAAAASVATPVKQEKTPEQKQDEKLTLELRERQRRKELGLPVKGEGGDDRDQKFPSETAGRIGILKVGIESLPRIAELARNFGEPGSEQNARAVAQFSAGVGDANKMRIETTNAVEGALRALTGAAATESEVARLRDLWMPTPFDTQSTRDLKVRLLGSTITNILAAVQQGRVPLISNEEASALLEQAITGQIAPTPARQAPGDIPTIDLNGNPIQ